jgi:hypothetical protein
MPKPNVRLVTMSRRELRRQHAALLFSIDLSREELEYRHEAYCLTPDEREVLREIREIEFLLEG